jgi:hypothetical protein
MKRATLVSLVLMIPVLCGGCAVDALTWALTGFGMVSGLYQPDYGSKPDPPRVCRAVHGQARRRERRARVSPGAESAGLSVRARAAVILDAVGLPNHSPTRLTGVLLAARLSRNIGRFG